MKQIYVEFAPFSQRRGVHLLWRKPIQPGRWIGIATDLSLPEQIDGCGSCLSHEQVIVPHDRTRRATHPLFPRQRIAIFLQEQLVRIQDGLSQPSRHAASPAIIGLVHPLHHLACNDLAPELWPRKLHQNVQVAPTSPFSKGRDPLSHQDVVRLVVQAASHHSNLSHRGLDAHGSSSLDQAPYRISMVAKGLVGHFR